MSALRVKSGTAQGLGDGRDRFKWRHGLWIEAEMIAIDRRLSSNGRKIGGAIDVTGGRLVSL
jgi:hypothetical protein